MAFPAMENALVMLLSLMRLSYPVTISAPRALYGISLVENAILKATAKIR